MGLRKAGDGTERMVPMLVIRLFDVFCGHLHLSCSFDAPSHVEALQPTAFPQVIELIVRLYTSTLHPKQQER